MTLRLSVVSEHGIRMGANATKVFSVHGGTIGRATDNAWILPDPERYLSGKHVRIDFRAGSYILVDTSSNGTYVNGAQVPLGKYHDYTLKDGDYLRLGEYELLVSIDKGTDFPTDKDAIVAYDGQARSSAVKKSTANDLGADLDLSELLEPSGMLGSPAGMRPRDAYGQAVQPAGPPAEKEGTPWHMMTRPFKVETPPPGAFLANPAAPPRAQNAALFDGDLEVGLAAFCRGAGVDPRSIGSEARGAALQLAGQLLREAVLGLMELNQSRNEFRNRFRLSTPARDGADSPLNLSQGVDDALMRLLTMNTTRASSVEAVRENFRELKAHSTASLASSRAAFEEFLNRVDPQELEERFDRATKRGVFGTQNKARYWELYAEMFAGLAQRSPDGFPHVYNEAFGKTYEAKLRALAPPKRTAFGPDRQGPDDPGQAAVDP